MKAVIREIESSRNEKNEKEGFGNWDSLDLLLEKGDLSKRKSKSLSKNNPQE